MLFIDGVWSASRAAVTHQRTVWNSILWLFVCVHMLVCVLSCFGHFHMTLQGQTEPDWNPPVTVNSKCKNLHLTSFVKFFHLMIEIKSYLAKNPSALHANILQGSLVSEVFHLTVTSFQFVPLLNITMALVATKAGYFKHKHNVFTTWF